MAHIVGFGTFDVCEVGLGGLHFVVHVLAVDFGKATEVWSEVGGVRVVPFVWVVVVGGHNTLNLRLSI